MEETIISKGVRFEGLISSEKTLIIFGTLKGQIHAKETVLIESTAHVSGDIIAGTLIVKGTFEGNADCETVSIQKGGLFSGNITSQTLAIESKGYFQGKNTPKKNENINVNQEKKLLKDPNTDNILL